VIPFSNKNGSPSTVAADPKNTIDLIPSPMVSRSRTLLSGEGIGERNERRLPVTKFQFGSISVFSII
jgi:hypothetical protein